MRSLCLALAIPLLSGCNPLGIFTVYRMEVQQGNYVTQEMASQLKLGMTRDQVRFVLGTPLLTDIFHSDRWDYVYRRTASGSRETDERRLTVFFADEKLVRVEGDVTPGEGAAAAKAVP